MMASDRFDSTEGRGTHVDPVLTSLLVATATGTGGEMGRQLWAVLRGLVRRNPTRETAGSPDPAAGEVELASLSEAPHDVERARRLSEALSFRAAQDPEFRANLLRWQQQAQMLRGNGDTRNTVTGGSQRGPIVQGRDFSGINFNAPGQG
jgi:hypothetical protein